MRILRFSRLFVRTLGYLNRKETTPVRFRQQHIGLTGGAVLLSISLFGTNKEKEKQKEKPQETDDLLLIREADLYYESTLIDNAYNILRRHRTSENPEILWRIARVLYKQGKASINPEERKRLYYEAFDFAKKALDNQPSTGNFGAHKWYAILLDRVGEMEGTKQRIANALEVKTHWERALEINPIDATTWHLLGVWHYEFADLAPYWRWAASVIYSKLPETNFDEALRCFERAEGIEPGFYAANNYYLGLLYEKLNRRDDALEQFKRAFYRPMVDTDDKEYHDKVLQHLRRNYKYDEEKLMDEKNSI